MGEVKYSKYFPVLEYYRKIVIPLNPKRYYIKGEKMMVCPCHNDHDPSLGIVNDGETVHCFGCNFWGNIIELHQRVCRRHFKKVLSYDEAIQDLCRIFKVDYSIIPKEEKKPVDKVIQQDIDIMGNVDKYDIQDFRQSLLDGKRQKKGIAYYNTAMIVMLGELKGINK